MTYETQAEQLLQKIDELERNEPECCCEQTGPDEYDNRHCGVCNEQSAYNRELLALQAQLRDVMAMVRYQASGEGAWTEEDAA